MIDWRDCLVPTGAAADPALPRRRRRVPRKCSTCARQDCPDRSWLIDWLHCGRWEPKEEDENDGSKAGR